jgi:CBS domain-containing protein
MLLRDICNRTVVVVGRDETIRDAVRRMREYHVGDVVVVDEVQGRRLPVGILTDRDIIIELVARDVDLDAVSVGDAMSWDLVTATEDSGVHEAVELMRSKGIRRLPVVDSDGVLTGIVTVDDLMELIAEQLGEIVQLVANETTRECQTRC